MKKNQAALMNSGKKLKADPNESQRRKDDLTSLMDWDSISI